MRDGAMVVLPWLVVSALVGVVVTGDNGVIGDLEFPGDAGITGDSKVTGDHTITHDAVIMGDVGVPGALVDTGYNWQDYFVSADTDPAFDEDTGGYEGEKGLCPHGCNMCGSDGSVRTFLCGGQELKYVDDNEGSFMEVVCHNWRVPLNCSRLPPLPARRPGSFQRVEVTSCILPPTMPISCATGGEGTTELTLQKAASSVTADNVRGLDAEQLFFMFEPDGCREVPVEAIKVLPRLRSVRILQGTSLPLRGDMFLASPPLTMLEISMSGVKEIPSNAFRGLAQLKTLSLFLNKIAYVAEEAFNGLDSLEKLVLNDNPITSFPPRVLPRTLRVLLLEKVPLSSLEEGVLEGLAHLQELSIDSRTNLTLGTRAFSRLPSLTSLKLTRSGVTSLPPDLFAETPVLLELILSYNRISSLQRQVFSPLIAVEKLDLSYNQISFVSSDIFLPLASLTNLNLDGNKIRSLPQYLFASLGNLTSVSLAHNQLTTILLDSFTAAGSIKHLSFSHNNLTWSASDAEFSSPFNSLLHLESLDLSHNGIGYVFSDWRYVLLHLKSLDLSYNKITSLTAADVQFFASVVVDLSHNHITEVVPGLVGSDTIEPSRTTLILNHNPFRCDCNLYHFLELVQSGDKKYSVDDATCSSPASVVHKPLRQVDMREATCAVPGVTAGCDCLTRPALNRTECICNNTRVPSIELTGFPEMYLRLTQLPTANDLLRLPAFVGTLNLTNLQLKHVPKLPDTIRTVDLSKNNIEKVPEQIWSRNITLKLAHNPLVCECSSTKQVKLIQTYNYSKISDYDNVTCFDGSLIKQKDWNALCDVYRSALAGTMFAVVLIFFAVIAALFYHYWIEIQVILYSRGWFLHLLPKEKIDSNKKYDVFVAFASEDEKFVLEEVLPRLSGYTLLVQDRDWIAGNTIPAEIHRSIEQSKRTLIILTSNFLKSKWAAEQFRTIHTQATNDKRLRAVVILLDVKKNELDRDTKTLLSLSTLLKYNESMFWDKVRYALPRKMYEYRQVKASLSEKEIALWKDTGAGLDVILSEEGKLVNKGFVKDIV